MTADANLYTRLLAELDHARRARGRDEMVAALHAVVELAEDMQRPGAPLFFPTFGLKVQMTIADQLGLTQDQEQHRGGADHHGDR